MEFLPGTASLVDEVDKKLLVVLRDGRRLVGILRTFDQFEETYERIYVENKYGEKSVGLFLIRGENVVLIGEIDVEKEKEILENKLTKIPFDEIQRAHKQELAVREEQAKLKKKAMLDMGIAIDPFTFADNLLAFE